MDHHSVYILLKYVRDGLEIPQHLLSPMLLQRHRFMNLSMADPASYICWPTTPDPAAILKALQSPELDLPDSEYSNFTFRYSFDGEYLHCHVAIPTSPNIRLVFMRDSDGEWKYHDTSSNPLSFVSYATPEEALSSFQNNAQRSPEPEENDTDGYWDSYGQEDDSNYTAGRGCEEPTDLSEDAYWAQYSSVQGTADSTVPSPIPAKAKPRPTLDPHHGSGAPPFHIEQELAERLAELSSWATVGDTPHQAPPSSGLESSERLGSTLHAPIDRVPMPVSQISTRPPSSVSFIPGVSLTTLPTPPATDFRATAEDSNVLFHAEAESVEPVAERQTPADDAVVQSMKATFYLWKANNKVADDQGNQAQLKHFEQLFERAISDLRL